jgi:hypothetical protein
MNYKLIIILSIIIIFIIYDLLYYYLYVKNLEISNNDKFKFMFIDNLHLFIIICFIYLVCNFECNLTKLFILNIAYLITILLFFIYKRCVLNTIQCNIGKIEEEVKATFFRSIICRKNDKEVNHDEEWINFSIPQISLVILINIYCFYNICIKPKIYLTH